MRHAVSILLIGAALLSGGCAMKKMDVPPSGQAQAVDTTGKSLTDADLDFLKKATKMTMTTKAQADIPKNWTITGQELQTGVAQMIPVLKEGNELKDGAIPSIPMVVMIFDFEGNKKALNVHPDRFEYEGKWYHLDNAAERTYSNFVDPNAPIKMG